MDKHVKKELLRQLESNEITYDEFSERLGQISQQEIEILDRKIYNLIDGIPEEKRNAIFQEIKKEYERIRK